MKPSSLRLMLAAAGMALPLVAFAQPAEVVTQWSYQTTDGQHVRGQQRSVEVSDKSFSSDEKMAKTLLLLDIARELKGSLEDYAKACNAPVERPDIRPLCGTPTPATNIMVPRCPMPPYPRPRPIPVDNCQEARRRVAAHLKSAIATLDGRVGQDQWTRSDRGVIEALDYARKLSSNMEKAPEVHYYPRYEGRIGIRTMAPAPMAAPAMASASLNVTSGGAQGYDQFKKIVDAGHVPASDVLAIDGFLKEFDLSLSDEHCNQLLCVSPAVTVDANAKKMYVQISMGSNVRPETFHRKPLNLSVVLDISGSMGATDGTEKSRLEWAKEALNRVIDELNSDDYLSIVLFDEKSEVLHQPAPVTDKASLKALVGKIQLGGSTNMEAGMRDGLRLVRSNLDNLSGYEHRVITISDAGTNTGIQDEASFVRLVNGYANDGIGMTVLGVGDDFRTGLVQGFAMTKGGNFQHAQTGLAMLKFFESFDYLVTPVAYNFKAALAVHGLNAKFSKAYGVPVKDGQPPGAQIDELIDIQTLFFSTGGGAIVLEYDLQ